MTSQTLNADGDSKRNRLSSVARKFDVDGDGVLNSTELAMREMDTENLGYISNAKVYQTIKEQNETQKKLLNMRHLILALLAFLVLLSLANVGTAFAAATLAKDTSTDSNVLVVKDTGEPIATDTNVLLVEVVDPVVVPANSTRRSIEGEEGVTPPGLEIDITSGTLTEDTVVAIHQACVSGVRLVELKIVDSKATKILPICGHGVATTVTIGQVLKDTEEDGQGFYWEPVDPATPVASFDKAYVSIVTPKRRSVEFVQVDNLPTQTPPLFRVESQYLV